MYTTKVNVNDLVIDMPLDEANVAQKMKSLKDGGLVQPVTVWLKDFRIIDGFHRTEAAKRIGWTEVDCVVKDCDEETFWDARIQSARQHHKVADDRMLTWIFECWQQTEWHVESTGNENLIQEISRLLWNIAKEHGTYSDLSRVNHPITQWIVSKAQIWQYEPYQLCKMLLNQTKWGMGNTIDFANSVAKQKGMDNSARMELLNSVKFNDMSESRYGGRLSGADIEAYAEHIISSTPDKRKSIRGIVAETIETERQNELQQLMDADKTRKAWISSDEGKRAMHKQVKDDFSVKVSALRAYVADHRTDFTQFDDGYEMLMSLSAWAATKAAELFPEREQPTEVQLRRELADAYKQIQSLQKALDSRKGYTPKLPDVLAWSSSEISKTQ